MTDYVRQLLLDGMMPDWVREGGYSEDSCEAHCEKILREWAVDDVDRFLKVLKDNHLYIVGTGVAEPRPEPPAFASTEGELW